MSVLSLVGAVFGVAEVALGYLEEREKNYPQKQAAALRQRIQRIQRDFYKEYNRPLENRSDAVLDTLYLELRIVLGDITSSAGAKNLSNSGKS